MTKLLPFVPNGGKRGAVASRSERDKAATAPAEASVAAVEQAIQSPPFGMERLLTPAEAATLLGLSKRTLDGWRLSGEGPAYVKISAQTVRYQAATIAAFIADRIRQNTAQ